MEAAMPKTISFVIAEALLNAYPGLDAIA